MIEKIGILGGGVMGSDLARFFLAKSFPVVLLEARDDLAAKARQKVERSLEKEVEKGKIDQPTFESWRTALTVGSDRAALKDADLVVEAVSEDLALKRALLAAVEQILGPEAILATNTSALPVSALAVVLDRPQRFLGTHFFNPAHIMPLVEVVPGLDTAGEVLDRITDFLSRGGKKPVVVKECPGFLVNRVMGAYMNEVFWLLAGEAGIREVEQAAMDLGMPMGPITLGEMVGWDIIRAANTTLAAYYGARFEVPPLLNRVVAEKRLGIKTGRGLFDYGCRPPVPTGDLAPERLGLEATGMEAIRVRLRASIIAESLRCLEERVAPAGEVDRALVLGAGLPRGPLTWADEVGLPAVLQELEDLSGRFGPRFWPAPVLRIHVMAGFIGPAAGRGLAGTY